MRPFPAASRSAVRRDSCDDCRWTEVMLVVEGRVTPRPARATRGGLDAAKVAASGAPAAAGSGTKDLRDTAEKGRSAGGCWDRGSGTIATYCVGVGGGACACAFACVVCE